MNKEQYIQWSKDRAMVYINQGNAPLALASFMSDINGHEDLKNNFALIELLKAIDINSILDVERFMEGLNG